MFWQDLTRLFTGKEAQGRKERPSQAGKCRVFAGGVVENIPSVEVAGTPVSGGQRSTIGSFVLLKTPPKAKINRERDLLGNVGLGEQWWEWGVVKHASVFKG